jgi:hypothetical protein
MRMPHPKRKGCIVIGQPNPARLGGWECAQRSNGLLTRRERLELLRRLAVSESRQLARRLYIATSRRAPRPADPDVDLTPPDSLFGREVEAAAKEQTPGLLAHSYRTWIYGRALASADGVSLDDEMFYAGCLLHDHGLISPMPLEDFTLRSARRALDCAHTAGRNRDEALPLADAITVHTTVGITVDRDGPLGCYLQAGAMVDLTGSRLWDLPRGLASRTLRQHGRHGFAAEIAALISAEAAAVPGGRFALLRGCGFIQLMKLAPFDRK